MRKLGLGLQMYTLRDETERDFEGTLRKVAALGYEGVEFAGYGGKSAEEVRDLLQELNLKAIGAHVSLQAIRDNLQGEIAYLKTIGAKYFICPWLPIEDYQTPEAWKSLFTLFEDAGKACHNEGLVFGYHNHAFEFEQEVDGQFVFDALYSSTSAEQVQVEMDTGWVQFAGQDTLAYIAKYAGRLPLVHLKDYRKGEQGEMITVELGNGELPLVDIISAADKAGSEWIIVEQDNCQNPPLESVETSMNWIKNNYLVLV
ncbi:sugar phosphate isomerase/epimerase family protein [Paenibacillus gansuensis]|uniref:Sugar phosphate isomerase/epimerase family protein n=1 Tax=Paenibacillus gansuensis TaxID=306542 RepID=A0ABW5PAV6_9BACL